MPYPNNPIARPRDRCLRWSRNMSRAELFTRKERRCSLCTWSWWLWTRGLAVLTPAGWASSSTRLFSSTLPPQSIHSGA